MQARDIMTPEPVVLTPRDSVAAAAELMRDYDVGIIPVVDDRVEMHLAGVITDRDIAIRCVAAHHDGNCRVIDHMTADHIDTVLPETDVAGVISRMEADQVRRIPVVDDRNRLIGIIAQADVATRFGRIAPLEVEEMLEEISEPARLGGR